MQGRKDVALNARGRAQVGGWALPRDCAKAAWITSPLRRASETARLLSGSEPEPVEPLIEMDWGAWEGFTLAELRTRYPNFAHHESRGLDFRPPGGESPRDVLERLQCWLERISSGTGSVVAVTHKGVIRALLAAATGWDMTCKPPVRLAAYALHRFTVDEKGHIAILECNIALAIA